MKKIKHSQIRQWKRGKLKGRSKSLKEKKKKDGQKHE
jgi:hypothetical protein